MAASLNIGPNPSGGRPLINDSAYVAPRPRSWAICGDWPRGFRGPRRGDPRHRARPGRAAGVALGARVSMAHGSLVHGLVNIGSDCFVGIRAVVIGADLEESVWVGVGATF